MLSFRSPRNRARPPGRAPRRLALAGSTIAVLAACTAIAVAFTIPAGTATTPDSPGPEGSSLAFSFPQSTQGSAAQRFASRPLGQPVDLRDCRDLTIENLTMRDFGPGVIAIRLENCQNVTIRAVDFLNVAQAVYAVDSGNITVVESRYSNIVGPAQPRTGANVANFVQFNNVSGGLIARNKGKGGDTEDIVSLYRTSGVVVEDNHFEGTDWTSRSGSGIAIGDGGGSRNVARRNVLVNPGQAGVFIAGGTGNEITDNVVIGQRRRYSNVGIYVWNQSASECSGSTVAGNRVSWVRADGALNPGVNDGNCGAVAGWAANAWGDSTLDIEQWRVAL